MIAANDFTCFTCQATTFKGEEAYQVYTIKFGKIKLCVLCSVAAERLGWDIE